ncbi:MAG: hypothetical protein K8R21_02420, partial [Leptospira sp.]|nr:hypothetical protein [Leptospira sp.]
MKLSLLLFFLSCLFQSGLFSDSTSKNPILIGASFNESYLGKYLLYLEDRKHSSVEEAKNSSNWIYKPGNEISFGFTDSSYWARFTLKNNSLFENLYLECNVATIDEIEIFIPQDGKFLSKISGDMHSFRSREIPYRTFIFNIPVKPNETKEFFIRLNNKGPMKFSFILQSPAAFSEKIFRDQVILGIYYGAAIIIILYNFFLFLSLRDTNYLNYVLYVASVGTYQMIINGHVAQFILKDSPLIVNLLPNIVANLSFFTGVLFSRKFLESKKYSPLTDKILIGLMLIAVMLIALTITTGHHSILIKTSNILGLLVMLSLITTGYLCLKKNYKPARFFLIGWSVLLFTVLIQI